jgi:hypothetical protein
MRLIDKRMQDGSRHFASLPKEANWSVVGNHVLLLPDAELINFIGEGSARAWLDFRFRRHRFLIDVCDERFRLFVDDPQCPDLILYQVGYHFERLLGGVADDERPPRPHLVKDAGPIVSKFEQ